MSENIITVHLKSANQPLIPLGSNSFEINLLETIYPIKSYNKCLICLNGFTGTIINEILPYIFIKTHGLVNTYEYTTSNDRNVCESSHVLDFIFSSYSTINSTVFEYKSNNDKWMEINIGNLANFKLLIEKSTPMLFNTIFLTLKIKLIE